MRFTQLRAFHHVAVCGGFSKAANALGLTQPAISDQVRKLEIDYDVRLFKRDGKKVELTPPGAKLLEITHRLFEVEQLAQDMLSESKTHQTGTLKIVADSARHILKILGIFRQRHPGIQISVSVGNSRDIPGQIRAYQADIGVIGHFPDGNEFDVVDLGTTRIVAFTKADNNANSFKSMTIQELADSALVLREKGSRTREKFEQQASLMGVQTTAHIEAEGREAIVEIVAGGGGIGIVSQAEFAQDPRLVQINISDAVIEMDEALICLHERRDSKLIRPFMKMARELTSRTPDISKLNRL